MGFFSKEEAPKRRPVAEIVSGLTTMVEDLVSAREMAAEEQVAVESEIERLAAERGILVAEQERAGAVTENLRGLLGMDLDGDGEPDDLSKAIAGWREAEAARQEDNVLGIDVDGDDDSSTPTA